MPRDWLGIQMTYFVLGTT